MSSYESLEAAAEIFVEKWIQCRKTEVIDELLDMPKIEMAATLAIVCNRIGPFGRGTIVGMLVQRMR